MKTLIITIILSISTFIFAGPHPHGPTPIPQHAPTPSHHHHHGSHHSSEIFWGITGGLALGSVVSSIINPKPVVVVNPTTPVVVQPVKVWVPEHFETRIVNGVVTSVFIPGHYEVR